MLISFSGIDGAGKSTQIDGLLHYLQQRDLRYTLFTFWDDVVVLSPLRERVSLKAFKGDPGVGSPERPITRRDKNVSSWYVIAFRLLLYLLDGLNLWIVASRTRRRGVDCVVFDRYIYDELANLPLNNRLVSLYVRLVLAIVPKPDLALLIDADPEAAFSRKPEYPLDFVRRNREAYLKIAQFAGMAVLPPAPIPETSRAIQELFSGIWVGKAGSKAVEVNGSKPAESMNGTTTVET